MNSRLRPIILGVLVLALLAGLRVTARSESAPILDPQDAEDALICSGHLRQLADAVENYRACHNGQAPKSLSEIPLFGDEKLPDCRYHEYTLGPGTPYSIYCSYHERSYDPAKGMSKPEELRSAVDLLCHPETISVETRQFHICKSNLKNIATACEMYSTDYEGRYPQTLSKLTPNYLKIIPPCPAAGKDTYSDTYQMASVPDAYTFCCAGDRHKVGKGYPGYNSTEGLTERP